MAKTQMAPRPDTHIAKVLDVLSDDKPHSTFELVRRAYNQNHASVARLGAVIYELKYRYDKCIIGARSKKNPTKYWYLMVEWDGLWEGEKKRSEHLLNIAKADEAAGMYE